MPMGWPPSPADEFTTILETKANLPRYQGNACDRCAYRWPSGVVTWASDPVAVTASDTLTAPAKVLDPELRALPSSLRATPASSLS